MTDNLSSLHDEEEKLRARQLAHVDGREAFRDHFNIVREAMNVIYGLTHDHPHKTDDELTIQFLGIRLFNAAAASIKLALSGYYQNAFQHLRDILETYFLIDYLKSYPETIPVWKVADRKQIMTEFGPGAIRTALDKRDGFTGGKRKQIYALISSHATHATYRGFKMTTKDTLGEIGPFMSEENLQAWLEEMAKAMTHAGVIYGSHFVDISLPLLRVKEKYIADISAWSDKYLSTAPAKPSI
jgi:hypothetical protein